MINNMYMMSLQEVLTTPGFLSTIGWTIAVGMVFGAKYNDGFRGFRRSLIILLPPFFLTIFSSLSRISSIESTGVILSHNAYNSIFGLILLNLSYIVGLSFGHILVIKTVKSILKKHKLENQNHILINN